MFVSYDEWLKMRQEILSKIKPTDEEHERDWKVAEELMNEIRKRIPDDIEIMLAGSFAKGTYIKGDVDFDIFLLYPEKYSLEELQDITIGNGKEILDDWSIAYAHHPYIKGKFKGYDVDIVPSYKIEDEHIHNRKIKSAVDRTQLHTKYILSHITDEQKDDVRILKKFLKRIGVYGAEIKIGGFSGYLCELLILKYGNFYNLIKEAKQNWRIPVAIDMAGKRSPRLLKVLFKEHPMILTDPVDKKRNVAAPVSADSLSRFIAAIHIFFMDPSTEMFFDEWKPLSLDEIKEKIQERGSYFLMLEMDEEEKSPDILWGELRRTLKNIGISLEQEGFEIIMKTVEVENGKWHMLFELEHGRLSNVRRHPGPYVRLAEHIDRFVNEDKKAVDVFVRDERLWAIRKRKFVHAREVIEDIKRNPIKHGVSKGLVKAVQNCRIFEGEDAVMDRSKWVFTKHLNQKFLLGLY